jgi:hypothetical protein
MTRCKAVWLLFFLLGGFVSVSGSLQALPIDEGFAPPFPIAEIESFYGDFSKTGLANLISPTQAVTARHIIEGASKIKASYNNQHRIITHFQELRDLKGKDAKVDKLANDIIVISWEEPIYSNKTFPSLATSPPKKGQDVYIPKYLGDQIIWEKKSISGHDSHCSWVGLPKPLYSSILWLNGEKINKGSRFEIGDSGGGWTTPDGTIVAVTSRVDNTSLSPHKQTAYGANTIVSQPPLQSNDRAGIAWRPMAVAASILVLVWLLTQIRNSYTKSHI